MKTKVEIIEEVLSRKGDPVDLSLNEVEENVIWPRINENRIREKVCKTVREEFENCQKSYEYAWPVLCFFKKVNYFYCVSHEKSNEDNKDDSIEEYLSLRSKYRQTNDETVLMKMKALVFPTKYPRHDAYNL